MANNNQTAKWKKQRIKRLPLISFHQNNISHRCDWKRVLFVENENEFVDKTELQNTYI